MEGNDFEDVIRTAVSLGGDCDTLTCIAGGIAEAFYGVPQEMREECRKRLPEDIRRVLDLFEETVRLEESTLEVETYRDPFLEGNEIIEEAIGRFYADPGRENKIAVLESIRHCMHEDGHFLVPVAVSEDGESFTFRTVTGNDGKARYAAFTSRQEYEKGEPSQILSNFIDMTLKAVMDNKGELLLNPWSSPFEIPYPVIELLFRMDEDWKKERQAALEDGSLLKEKIGRYLSEQTERSFLNILSVLQESWVYIPCSAVMGDADQKKIEEMVSAHKDDLSAMKGQSFTSDDPVRMIPDILQSGEEYFFPVFTSIEEMGEYGDGFSKIARPVQEALALAKNNEKNVAGLVINAFTDNFTIPRKMFRSIEKDMTEGAGEEEA